MDLVRLQIPSKIAFFHQVDGYTITSYNSGNKGEKDNV